MDIQETLARNTRHYRKRQHISQEELAQRCGLARAQVGLIENGKNITISTLERLASGLNVSPMRLLISFDDDGQPILDCPVGKMTILSNVDKLYDADEINAFRQFNVEHEKDSEEDVPAEHEGARKDSNNTYTQDEDKDGEDGNNDAQLSKDSATDLKNCALVYWGNGALEFQELSVEAADPSIKIMSILLQTTSSDLEFFERYKAVWPEIMRLLKIKPECEWK